MVLDTTGLFGRRQQTKQFGNWSVSLFFQKTNVYLPKKREEIGNAAPFKVASSFNQA